MIEEALKGLKLAKIFMYHSNNCEFVDSNHCDCGYIQARIEINDLILKLLDQK